jgi:hypothetical protein
MVKRVARYSIYITDKYCASIFQVLLLLSAMVNFFKEELFLYPHSDFDAEIVFLFLL